MLERPIYTPHYCNGHAGQSAIPSSKVKEPNLKVFIKHIIKLLLN